MKKAKIAERFTEMQMLKLVEIYKRNDCLWDVSHELYHVKESREIAYRKIWEELNIPGLSVEDIPQKIKNLRSSYYQELKKIDASIKKGASLYKPKVSWFVIADSFFKTFSKTPGFIIRPQVDNENFSLNNDSDSTEETITNLDRIAKNVSPKPSVSSQQNKPQDKDEEDEFEMFGKYIATALRSMPTEMSIISKMELQKTLADIQLRALRQRNRSVMPEYGASTSNQSADEDPLTTENIMVNIKTEIEED